MAIEEEFSVEIPDEKADKLTCCADIASFIVSETQSKAPESCLYFLSSLFCQSKSRDMLLSAIFICVTAVTFHMKYSSVITLLLYQKHENFTYNMMQTSLFFTQ